MTARSQSGITSPNAPWRTDASAQSRWWLTITTDGLGGAVAHPRDEAVGVARALAAEALLARRRELGPERQVVRQVFDLGAIAGLRRRQPTRRSGASAPIVLRQRRERLDQPFEAMQAEVVRAALHVGGADRVPERARQRRHVLVEDLILQRARARGDEHAPAGEHGRDEVGERLADAGAGLGDERAAVVEQSGDLSGEPPLAGPRLEALERARERTLGRERGVHDGDQRWNGRHDARGRRHDLRS